jgi:hypothetical protein
LSRPHKITRIAVRVRDSSEAAVPALSRCNSFCTEVRLYLGARVQSSSQATSLEPSLAKPPSRPLPLTPHHGFPTLWNGWPRFQGLGIVGSRLLYCTEYCTVASLGIQPITRAGWRTLPRRPPGRARSGLRVCLNNMDEEMERKWMGRDVSGMR